MDNHFRAIVAGPKLAQTIRDLKKFTAREIIAQLQPEGPDWLLNQLAYYRAKYKSDSQHQVWQEGVHPQSIPSDEVMLQKREYIHNNPVKRGLIAAPEHWRFSSAHEWLAGGSPVMRLGTRGVWLQDCRRPRTTTLFSKITPRNKRRRMQSEE